MKHLITTVHLVIPIPDNDDSSQPGYTEDLVSNILTETLEYLNIITDWGYTHTHDNIIVEFPEEYKEGDFISHIKPVKYSVFHNIDGDKTSHFTDDASFIHFVRQIAVENEDDELSILSVGEAAHYITNYCPNLTLNIHESKV